MPYGYTAPQIGGLMEAANAGRNAAAAGQATYQGLREQIDNEQRAQQMAQQAELAKSKLAQQLEVLGLKQAETRGLLDTKIQADQLKQQRDHDFEGEQKLADRKLKEQRLEFDKGKFKESQADKREIEAAKLALEEGKHKFQVAKENRAILARTKGDELKQHDTLADMYKSMVSIANTTATEREAAKKEVLKLNEQLSYTDEKNPGYAKIKEALDAAQKNAEYLDRKYEEDRSDAAAVRAQLANSKYTLELGLQLPQRK